MVRFCGAMEYKFGGLIIVIERRYLPVSNSIRTMHPYTGHNPIRWNWKNNSFHRFGFQCSATHKLRINRLAVVPLNGAVLHSGSQ